MKRALLLACISFALGCGGGGGTSSGGAGGSSAGSNGTSATTSGGNWGCFNQGTQCVCSQGQPGDATCSVSGCCFTVPPSDGNPETCVCDSSLGSNCSLAIQSNPGAVAVQACPPGAQTTGSNGSSASNGSSSGSWGCRPEADSCVCFDDRPGSLYPQASCNGGSCCFSAPDPSNSSGSQCTCAEVPSGQCAALIGATPGATAQANCPPGATTGTTATNSSAGTNGSTATNSSAGTNGSTATNSSAGSNGSTGTSSSAGSNGSTGTSSSAGSNGSSATNSSAGTNGSSATSSTAGSTASTGDLGYGAGSANLQGDNAFSASGAFEEPGIDEDTGNATLSFFIFDAPMTCFMYETRYFPRYYGHLPDSRLVYANYADAGDLFYPNYANVLFSPCPPDDGGVDAGGTCYRLTDGGATPFSGLPLTDFPKLTRIVYGSATNTSPSAIATGSYTLGLATNAVVSLGRAPLSNDVDAGKIDTLSISGQLNYTFHDSSQLRGNFDAQLVRMVGGSGGTNIYPDGGVPDGGIQVLDAGSAQDAGHMSGNFTAVPCSF